MENHSDDTIIRAAGIDLVDSSGNVSVQIRAEARGEGAMLEMIGAKDRLLIKVMENGEICLTIDSLPKMGDFSMTKDGFIMGGDVPVIFGKLRVPERQDSEASEQSDDESAPIED